MAWCHNFLCSTWYSSSAFWSRGSLEDLKGCVLMFVQKLVIMVIWSGSHSDLLMAKIMQGAAMQKSSHESLLSLTMLLDSLEASAGTSDVDLSSLFTSESTSSSRMLKALAASSKPTLVKYQRGTWSPLFILHVARAETIIGGRVGTPLCGIGMNFDLFLFLSSFHCSSLSLSTSSSPTPLSLSFSCQLQSCPDQVDLAIVVFLWCSVLPILWLEWWPLVHDPSPEWWMAVILWSRCPMHSWDIVLSLGWSVILAWFEQGTLLSSALESFVPIRENLGITALFVELLLQQISWDLRWQRQRQRVILSHSVSNWS